MPVALNVQRVRHPRLLAQESQGHNVARPQVTALCERRAGTGCVMARTALALLAFVAGASAFAPGPSVLPRRSVAATLRMAAAIQFYPGKDEPDIPDVRLTRSVDAQTGVAKFRFGAPSFFQVRAPASFAPQFSVDGLVTSRVLQEENDIPDEMFKSMTLVDDEGEMVTTKVDAGFVNGKPKSIEATLEMTTPGDWDRFMRFMERYAEANGLGIHQRFLTGRCRGNPAGLKPRDPRGATCGAQTPAGRVPCRHRRHLAPHGAASQAFDRLLACRVALARSQSSRPCVLHPPAVRLRRVDRADRIFFRLLALELGEKAAGRDAGRGAGRTMLAPTGA